MLNLLNLRRDYVIEYSIKLEMTKLALNLSMLLPLRPRRETFGVVLAHSERLQPRFCSSHCSGMWWFFGERIAPIRRSWQNLKMRSLRFNVISTRRVIY